ncbi:PREDICTED: uncharacterized protein LOC104772599 [Camelina sativa]|uniref:Uncharacterized protein LOC104772599 n=1 Tax=Camelina sativa TaxID=90675 RepID=A0ABM0Y4T0_CAMSA|nr:PREDICTED: uncharacterized protein LOC104772599 [Camelina sativa]
MILLDNGEVESEDDKEKEEDLGPVFDEQKWQFEYPTQGTLLVTRRSLSVQSKSNDREQRENLFHSRCLVKDKYVREQVTVPLTIGRYEDEILCNVLPMDASHILLGRPWQFDMRAIHDGYTNRHSFEHKGKKITLVPLTPLEVHQDQVQLKKSRDKEIKTTKPEEFSDIFPKENPNALVRSNRSVLPSCSFKVSENATYNCVDINKQPGIDHPLLQNHTIQVVGVRSRAGPYRGVEAWYNGYTLNIGKDQASYSEIYIGSWLNNQVNFIQACYIINPSFFGTRQLWTYGYFKGKDGKGCYNTACDGFIQVSRRIPIVQPINLNPGVPDWTRWSIHQDKATGNWWLTQLIKNASSVDIGYWPKELFDILNSGANTVGVGGIVRASHSGSSPPMGNGNFPVGGGRTDSALFTNIEALDSNYNSRKMNSFPMEILVDSPKCYGIRIGRVKPFHRTRLGFFFNYGGPGGNSC